MVRIRDAFLNTDDFDFQINHQGVVQLSFGPTHVCMTIDSTYELQYQLAAFLAYLELKDYPKNEAETSELSESKDTLEYLAAYRRSKRVEA